MKTNFLSIAALLCISAAVLTLAYGCKPEAYGSGTIMTGQKSNCEVLTNCETEKSVILSNLNTLHHG